MMSLKLQTAEGAEERRVQRPSAALILPWLIACVLLGPVLTATAQSGAGGVRTAGHEYAVNLTFAVYQYDALRSQPMPDLSRLAVTYSTAQEEIAYLKDKNKLEELAVRHIRSVGLRSGETFNDAVLLGPQYMVFTVTPRDVVRGYMKLDLRVRYANEGLLELNGVEFENFETVMLR